MTRGIAALPILLLAVGLPLAAALEEDRKNEEASPLAGEAAAATATEAPETAATAGSQENPATVPASLPARLVSNRWGFQLGGFLMEFSTEAAMGSGGLLGTLIQLEDRLGLEEDKSTLRADGFVRFNNRHGLDIGYWNLNREGQVTLAEEIDFEGITYIQADLTSKWNTDWLKLAWRFALLNNPKGEAGITAGLSTYRWDLGLQGTARITDDQGGSVEVEGYATDRVIVAPVPVIGFFLNYAIKPKWLFRVRGDVMDLDYTTSSGKEYDGKLLDMQVGMEWYFTPAFGVGASLNSTEIEVKVGGNKPYSVEYDQSGLYAYLTFVFGERPPRSKLPKVKP